MAAKPLACRCAYTPAPVPTTRAIPSANETWFGAVDFRDQRGRQGVTGNPGTKAHKRYLRQRWLRSATCATKATSKHTCTGVSIGASCNPRRKANIKLAPAAKLTTAAAGGMPRPVRWNHTKSATASIAMKAKIRLMTWLSIS
jgi:hypothetical protein